MRKQKILDLLEKQTARYKTLRSVLEDRMQQILSLEAEVRSMKLELEKYRAVEKEKEGAAPVRLDGTENPPPQAADQAGCPLWVRDLGDLIARDPAETQAAMEWLSRFFTSDGNTGEKPAEEPEPLDLLPDTEGNPAMLMHNIYKLQSRRIPQGVNAMEPLGSPPGKGTRKAAGEPKTASPGVPEESDSPRKRSKDKARKAWATGNERRIPEGTPLPPMEKDHADPPIEELIDQFLRQSEEGKIFPEEASGELELPVAREEQEVI